MGVTSSSKQISTNLIDCGGMLKVTLALSASPDIVTNPTDIVLVLDRSGSMAGSPLENMKAGAKTFIDIIEAATNDVPGGDIGSGRPHWHRQLCRRRYSGHTAYHIRQCAKKRHRWLDRRRLDEPCRRVRKRHAAVRPLFAKRKSDRALYGWENHIRPSAVPRGSGSKGVRHYHLLHWLNLARTGWTLTP